MLVLVDSVSERAINIDAPIALVRRRGILNTVGLLLRLHLDDVAGGIVV